jgi:hypothetical protein
MKHFKKREIDVLADITCDICKKSCKPAYLDYDSAVVPNDFEVATLRADWGYGSKKDGVQCCVHMCEACFDDVIAHIDAMKTKQQCRSDK